MRDFSFLRVWLWQSWQNEVQGILIWNTNYWHSSKVYPQGLQNPYLNQGKLCRNQKSEERRA